MWEGNLSQTEVCVNCLCGEGHVVGWRQKLIPLGHVALAAGRDIEHLHGGGQAHSDRSHGQLTSL